MMPSSGQKGLRRLVSCTDRGPRRTSTLSMSRGRERAAAGVGAGARAAGPRRGGRGGVAIARHPRLGRLRAGAAGHSCRRVQEPRLRLQSRRTRAVADDARHRHVVELAAGRPRSAAGGRRGSCRRAPRTRTGKQQALAEDLQQDVHVLAAGDAAQQHDLAVRPRRGVEQLARRAGAAAGSAARPRRWAPPRSAAGGRASTGDSGETQAVAGRDHERRPARPRAGARRRARRRACPGSRARSGS